MPKYFKHLPAEFEEYNPEAVIPYNMPYASTVDEQGRLHSFNDEPATVTYSSTSRIQLTWYNHGVVSREGNKPCKIICTKDYYSTLNADDEVHSYDGKPSGIRISNSNANCSLEWKENNVLHREGDLPANITWANGKISTTRYAQHGKGHRDDGLPATISEYNEVWFICGQLHNRHGMAIEEKDKETFTSEFKYGLYGVKLKKEVFERIQAYYLAKKVPLWVSFLYELGLLTDEIVLSLKGNDSILNYSVPTQWKLRSLGVTNEKFKEAVKARNKNQIGYGFYRMEFPELMQLDALVDVVEYEEGLDKKL